MMVRNRIKAAIVSAAMVASTFATPAISTFTTVHAGGDLASLPHTFIADGIEDGERQGNAPVPSSVKASGGDTLYLSFTTTSKANASIGVYGFGTDSAEDKYWYAIPKADEKNFTYSSGGKSTFECAVVIPSAIKGNITKVGLGVWYPEDNSEWTLESITASSSGTSKDPTTPEIPVTENDKSGTCELVDNGDGTATITATLSAQYAETDADGNSNTQFDILLTQGTDEEQYAPYLDENGEVLPEWTEGDPINSRKFKFTNFNIDDIANVKFQSFEYVIESPDYDMSTIQYGGGINVEAGSPADTEKVKGKNGYWYNDQGEEDMEAYGDQFLIDDVHGGYEATGCGGYTKLVWDVPKGVQPYVDYSNAQNAVGFQYWWGKDDTKTSTNEANEEMNYAVIPELHLKSCTATYTRTMTVPYTDTVDGPKNTKLTLGSDETNQVRFPLADIELGERDKLSAVEFTFTSAEAMAQFVGGCGISVDESKVQEAAGVNKGWYQTGNIAVINDDDGKFSVMWIIPEAIRNGIYPDGDVLMGYWYGDVEGGEKVNSVTISDVKYHVYRTQEEEIEIVNPDTGLTVPSEIELTVGETYDLNVNVDGATFDTSRSKTATVDENGTITAVGEGIATITVTTPEGQEATITVTVKGAVTTTTTTTSKATSTSKTTVTTVTTTTTTPVDPDTIIDWSGVLYGDVNVNQVVEITDIIYLSKHIAVKATYPLKNATAQENADCSYDGGVNSSDLGALIEFYISDDKEGMLLKLGKADKSDCPMYNKDLTELFK